MWNHELGLAATAAAAEVTLYNIVNFDDVYRFDWN